MSDQVRGYQLSSAIANRLTSIFGDKESTQIFEMAIDTYTRSIGYGNGLCSDMIKYGKHAKIKGMNFPQSADPLGSMYSGAPEAIKAGEQFLKFLQGMQE